MTQDRALEIMETGQNVFLTGIAGGGKTFLLNEFIRKAKERKVKLAITASTGIAAVALHGRTIHSFSGIGIKDKFTERDYATLLNNKFITKRINKISILIIDEISMLSGQQLDLIDAIFRKVRKSEESFGGVQVIFCGDFIQLPPVGSNTLFAFESKSWKESNLSICFLDKPIRQKEEHLLKVLNAIRSNNINSETKRLLYQRTNKNIGENDVLLFSRNEDVDKHNEKELSQLSGRLHVYSMEADGQDSLIQMLKRNCLSPESLELKKGAKVMVTKNLPKENVVNGTQARVVKCNKGSVIVKTSNEKEIELFPEAWVVVDEEDKVIASIEQIPLRLAYAMTIHKAQGMTLDNATIDLSRVFELGQGYVALSRLRSINNINIRGTISMLSFKVNEKCLAQEKIFIEESKKLELPTTLF